LAIKILPKCVEETTDLGHHHHNHHHNHHHHHCKVLNFDVMLAKLLQDILKDTIICTKGISTPFPTAQNKKSQTNQKNKKKEQKKMRSINNSSTQGQQQSQELLGLPKLVYNYVPAFFFFFGSCFASPVIKNMPCLWVLKFRVSVLHHDEWMNGWIDRWVDE
jgi:hypothetical protein